MQEDHLLIPRHKWLIVEYVGCALPQLSGLVKAMVRIQLMERYCPHCGEYIYNPYPRRNIRHLHFGSRLKFKPLLNQRLVVYPSAQLVEWTRKFPHVMKLMLSDKDMYFYGSSKPSFVHRLPAQRMWTIEEWNMFYPHLRIGKQDGVQRIEKNLPVEEVLFTPELAY